MSEIATEGRVGEAGDVEREDLYRLPREDEEEETLPVESGDVLSGDGAFLCNRDDRDVFLLLLLFFTGDGLGTGGGEW